MRKIFGAGPYWLRRFDLDKLDSPIPDLLNTRYVISYSPDASKPAIQHPKLARAADLPGHQVYENKNVLPRFYLVGETRLAANQEEALGLLRSPKFDPRRAAVVESAVGPLGPPGQVRVLEYGLRSVVLGTESPGAAFLVTSETHYPGWRAFVDGRPEPLVLTNVAFRGLAVPAGRHRIEMRFEPRILWYGLGLTLLGVAGLLGALLVPKRVHGSDP